MFGAHLWSRQLGQITRVDDQNGAPNGVGQHRPWPDAQNPLLESGFCTVDVDRGGGGTRTRVLRVLNGSSPSAARGNISSGRTSPAPGDRSSQVRCPLQTP